jgi:hypothetical protein
MRSTPAHVLICACSQKEPASSLPEGCISPQRFSSKAECASRQSKSVLERMEIFYGRLRGGSVPDRGFTVLFLALWTSLASGGGRVHAASVGSPDAPEEQGLERRRSDWRRPGKRLERASQNLKHDLIGPWRVTVWAFRACHLPHLGHDAGCHRSSLRRYRQQKQVLYLCFTRYSVGWAGCGAHLTTLSERGSLVTLETWVAAPARIKKASDT